VNDRAAHEGVANDRIFVTGLALHAYHGVMPHEAKVGQSFALDPGVGFGKTPEQSMAVIARLEAFRRFGRPLLVGASRKRFINTVVPSSPDHRLGGSIAAHLLAVRNGASIVRVHDVAETVQALRVAAAIGSAS